MSEENLVEKEEVNKEEDLLDTKEDSISVQEETSSRKGRKSKVDVIIKDKSVVISKFKSGDAVRICPRVGFYIEGKLINRSNIYSKVYVNKVNNDIVELRDSSGKILGSLHQRHINKF